MTVTDDPDMPASPPGDTTPGTGTADASTAPEPGAAVATVTTRPDLAAIVAEAQALTRRLLGPDHTVTVEGFLAERRAKAASE